jgi:hypothetical protein
LARARLLIDSLDRCWRDATPLHLVVICPDEDLAAVSDHLKGTARIDVAHYGEGAFLPSNSDFYRMPGWWKQQFLKLYIPAILDLGAYLTLDSDIVCCRPFTGTTFVRAGKLISQWEPKGCQEWWRNIASVRGCAYDERSFGLSVTPNILHSALSRQALFSLADDISGALRQLLDWYRLMKRGSTWTEYSLYTTSAEIDGNLYHYHLPPQDVFTSGVSIHSRQNIWDSKGYEHIGLLTQATLGGYLLIVQSTAGIPVDAVRDVASRVTAEADF